MSSFPPRPDDVSTIRLLSSVLSSLNDEIPLPIQPLASSTSHGSPVHDDFEFFNHLATMLNTGEHDGLDVAVTGKFDDRGPMVTVVVSRNSPPGNPDSHTATTETREPNPLGFTMSTIRSSGISSADIRNEVS